VSLRKNILRYSYKHNLGHIASSFSMVDYLQHVFNYIDKDDKIIIGKPFGSQTYYIIWKKLGWLNDIDNLSVGVKHDEIDFVDYSEETMGNALGVAAGIAMTTSKNVYVNISDAALQMGNTLEAIQFIGQQQLKNIICTVDYNNSQVTGKVHDIIDIKPVFTMFKEYNWKIFEVDGHNHEELNSTMKQAFQKKENPTLIICKTKKGKGIKTIEKDIKKWHYKKIETLKELQLLEQELQDT